MIPLTSILFIDDEPALRDITRLFLQKYEGFVVTTASSANEALEYLKHGKFDVIVSDYSMPEMSGIDLLKKLRSENNETPFIIFTGRGREDVAIEALNTGADFYLMKGEDPKSQFAELKNLIEKAVKRRSALDELLQSAHRLATIIHQLPEPTFAINKEGVVIAWNQAIEELTGVSAAEMLGKDNYEYAVPFYGKRRPLLVDVALENPSRLDEGQYPVMKRVGRTIFAETSLTMPRFRGSSLWLKASPLYSTEGDLIGAIETIRDITELRLGRKRSSESEARYRVLAESMVGWYIHNEDGAEWLLREKGILQTFKVCPFCRSQRIGRIRRDQYKCYHCKKEWSPRRGSPLEGFRTPYNKFLMAIMLFRFGTSVREASRQLGLAYNTTRHLYAIIRNDPSITGVGTESFPEKIN